MYLRAERRHLAELAAARLLETTTPVRAARPPQAPARLAAEPAVVDLPDVEAAILPRPPAPASRDAHAQVGVSDSAADPLAQFRSEALRGGPSLPDQAPPPSDRRLPLAASTYPFALLLQRLRAAVHPLSSRTFEWITGDRPGIGSATALGTILVAAVVAMALMFWPGSSEQAPAETTAAVVQAETTPVAPVAASTDANAIVAASPAGPPLAPSASGSPVTSASGGRPDVAAPAANPAPPRPIARRSPRRATPRTPAVTPARAALEGQLRVTSTPPGARVTVNGIGWGQTPLTIGHLPLGVKTVRITREGYTSAQRTVDLRTDASSAVHVALQPVE
jgi:hypothetical protein